MSRSHTDLKADRPVAVAKPAAGNRARRTRPDDETRVYDAIHRAIAERRLPPGTKLAEEQLAEIFAVTRARIRTVLQHLARDRVITLERNRGAFVAKPSVQEAREVFAARRLIEVALAREVVAAIDERGLKLLKAHIRKEEQAETRGDRRAELKTSHDFHLLLARMAGNGVLTAYVDELLSRSALITAIYERPNAELCSHVGHEHLVDLLEAGDADGFADAMARHLDEIESELVLVERPATGVDLGKVFGKS